MARYTGAVRFIDGEIRYFVYDGTVDVARPRLFVSSDSAFYAWDDEQDDVYEARAVTLVGDEVEVMPYYCHDKADVMFVSTANRDVGLITGPLSTYDECFADGQSVELGD